MGLYHGNVPSGKIHIAMESPLSLMISLDLPIESGDVP